jgi:vacuolar-type H+-ATPase subunit D/Vma8
MINTEHTRKLLQASIDLIEKDNEIAALKAQLEARDRRIAALEGHARRSIPPFKRDQTQRKSYEH